MNLVLTLLPVALVMGQYIVSGLRDSRTCADDCF